MATLRIDNALERRIREAAAAQGKSVEQFVGEILEGAVTRDGVRVSEHEGLPVFIVPDGAPPIDIRKVRSLIEEDGF